MLGNGAGELAWLAPLLVVLSAADGRWLLLDGRRAAVADAALALGFGVLLLAPAIWSVRRWATRPAARSPPEAPRAPRSAGRAAWEAAPPG